jgi:hypothetical protein
MEIALLHMLTAAKPFSLRPPTRLLFLSAPMAPTCSQLPAPLLAQLLVKMTWPFVCHPAASQRTSNVRPLGLPCVPSASGVGTSPPTPSFALGLLRPISLPLVC